MAVATAAAAAAGVPVDVAALSYRFVPKRVCFSFAAYAKSVIYHLASCDVPVLEGLTAAEFDCLESAFSFAFPPDLREILQEGLPVGPGFVNWRSSSPQQLRILAGLPGRCLIKEVSRSDFWCDAWGERPSGRDRAVELAERFLEEAPALEFEWLRIGVFRPAGKLPPMIVTPAWAATAPRRIEFWSDVAEKGGRRAPAPAPEPARVSTGGWWSAGGGVGGGGGGGGELGACLDEAFWRLRDGGWREEEVREMMGMGGCDGMVKVGGDVARSDGGIARHVTAWSLELLRGGWSREDVVQSLGINVDEEREVGVCDPHDRG
ncbi:hypothetical protein EUGRSUZ_I00637 [Eucalyptus grandis]|uniref:Uncharacterized protein n=2 Tax=Eucalyptus grandis TaxID=71139 RepID=A0ACC3JCT5_EUCGR|nr:hypothetical protein EUGRSUZ_I00637 [Eucalyptus grandis]